MTDITDLYEKTIQELSSLVENREHYQRRLGELAFKISNEYGFEILDQLAEDLKETHGLHVSPSTLRNYLWVYKATKDLDIPQDINYRNLQFIAASSDPASWAEKIKKLGLSSRELSRLLKIERGEPTRKTITCPNCHVEFYKK